MTGEIYTKEKKFKLFEFDVGDEDPRENFPEYLKASYSMVRTHQDTSKFELFYNSCGRQWLIVEELHFSGKKDVSYILHLVDQEGEIKMSKQKNCPFVKINRERAGGDDSYIFEENTCASKEKDEVQRETDPNVRLLNAFKLPTWFEWIIVKCPSFPGKTTYKHITFPSEVYFYKRLETEYDCTLVFEYEQKEDESMEINFLTFMAVNGKYYAEFGCFIMTATCKKWKRRTSASFANIKELEMFIIGYVEIRFGEDDFRALYTRERKRGAKKVFERAAHNNPNIIQDIADDSSQNKLSEVFRDLPLDATVNPSQAFADNVEKGVANKELIQIIDHPVIEYLTIEEEIAQKSNQPELRKKEIEQMEARFHYLKIKGKSNQDRTQEPDKSDQMQVDEHDSQASTQELGRYLDQMKIDEHNQPSTSKSVDPIQEMEHDSQAPTQELGRPDQRRDQDAQFFSSQEIFHPEPMAAENILQNPGCSRKRKVRKFSKKKGSQEKSFAKERVDAFMEETKREYIEGHKLLDARLAIWAVLEELAQRLPPSDLYHVERK